MLHDNINTVLNTTDLNSKNLIPAVLWHHNTLIDSCLKKLFKKAFGYMAY